MAGDGSELDRSNAVDKTTQPSDPLEPAGTANRPGRLERARPEGGPGEPLQRRDIDWLGDDPFRPNSNSTAEGRNEGHAPRVLSEAEESGAISVHAATAIRLLMLTGCRKNESLTLRWTDVDLEAKELHLADSKKGARTVSLSPGTARVLAGIPRAEGNPWSIPGRIKGERLRNIDHPWYIDIVGVDMSGEQAA